MTVIKNAKLEKFRPTYSRCGILNNILQEISVTYLIGDVPEVGGTP